MTESITEAAQPPAPKPAAELIFAGDRIYDDNLAAAGIALIVDGDRLVYWSDGGPDHVMGLMWCYTKEASRIADRTPPPAAMGILRTSPVQRRMLLRLLGVTTPDASNEYETPTPANMTAAIGRITLARRLIHQVEDLIGWPQDDPTSPGWGWADDVPASIAVGLLKGVIDNLDHLEQSATYKIASTLNDSRLAAAAKRRAR